MGTPDSGPAAPKAAGTPRPGASRTRPSPRSSRLMISAGALAAFTVIAAGLARFPAAADDTLVGSEDSLAGTSGAKASAKANAKAKVSGKAKARSERPVKYIRLKPGQKAPKGAKVIQEAAPTPRIVVRRSAPAVQRSSPVRVVTRTRQSG